MMRLSLRTRHTKQQPKPATTAASVASTQPSPPTPPPDRHAHPPRKRPFLSKLASSINHPNAIPVSSNNPNCNPLARVAPCSIPCASAPNSHPNSQSSPLSVLVNHQQHPTRNDAGHALDYASYTPSRFYVTPSSSTAQRSTHRRPRSAASSSSSSSSLSSALALDYDTLARHPHHLQPDFLPLHKQIQARIVRLRQLLTEGDRIGDLQMLKDLAELLQSNIATHHTQAQSKRSQIAHAHIVAALVPSPATDLNHTIRVKKVSGKPNPIRNRATAAFKLRSASMRSASRHARNTVAEQHKQCTHSAQNAHTTCHHHQQSAHNAKSDLSRLTRKSSAHLRRLHSAGAVLIRKLSNRWSPSSQPQQAPCCTDQKCTSNAPLLHPETIKKLKTDPIPIINQFKMELHAIEQEHLLDRDKLEQVESQLAERRRIHHEAMQILDQFYGALPGWENDPISQKMILETVELTEAGVHAERDLSESRDVLRRAEAALADHQRAQRALQIIRSDLTSFVQILSDLISSADVIVEMRGRGANSSCAARRYSVDVQTEAGEGVLDTFCQLERLLDRCIGQARLAVECCCEAPRVHNLQEDLEQISGAFALEADAVKKNGTIYHDDLQPTLQVSVTALGDCKMADSFVLERQQMIAEDLNSLRNQLERSEEYVMMERLAILDLRHPRDDE